MTQREILDTACQQTGLTDTASRAAAARLLELRHSQLWEAFLWRASIALGTVPVERAHLLLPPDCATLLHLWREDGAPLAGEELAALIRLDAAGLERTGDPVAFAELEPAVARVTQTLRIHLPDESDAGRRIVLRFESDTGVAESIVREVSRGWSSVWTGPGWLVAASGDPGIGVNGTAFFDGDGIVPLATLACGVCELPRRARVRLSRLPKAPFLARYAAKRHAPPLKEPGASPGLRGSEAVLLAELEADLWERARQHGKAQLLRAEADRQRAALIAREWQSAGVQPRIIPEGWAFEMNHD
jgi:hypothetical protein